jgi:hypothetical protein
VREQSYKSEEKCVTNEEGGRIVQVEIEYSSTWQGEKARQGEEKHG